MSIQKPTIYPTLVIGVGGTGTNVARYVKRRFLRTWSDENIDNLPSVLQILAVDTEPLVNTPGEEPLYFHEFSFLGKFDATRLVQNRTNHSPYLDWWQWNEGDIPLGYIHNGAKQLRPIGRLSFFRNYVTFKTMLIDKLNAMKEEPGIQEVQNHGFPVANDHRLIYIVSSLCGGTGAGMFLDVAHCVRHYAGANTTIVGIFMLPSVFEKSVRSDLQRRRIQANAYAALKELNHFHTNPSFTAHYPSEQGPIPTVPTQALNQIFLLERTSASGRNLSSKAATEQMAAHLIHLTAFSHLNKDILAAEVNVTQERSQGSRRILAYSSFGASALVMPQNALWRSFGYKAAAWAMPLLLDGQSDQQASDSAFSSYLALVARLRQEARRYSSAAALDALRDDMAAGQGRWLGFTRHIFEEAPTILQKYGVNGLREVMARLALEANSDELQTLDLAHSQQIPFDRPQPVRALRFWERYFFPPPADQIADRDRRVEEANLYDRRLAVWNNVVKNIQTLALQWLQQIDELIGEINKARTLAEQDAQQTAQQINPLQRNGDHETSTFYDLETGAISPEQVEQYWSKIGTMLWQAISSDPDAGTYWDSLLTGVRGRILPADAEELTVLKDTALRLAVEEELQTNPVLQQIRQEANQQFDLRTLVYTQHSTQSRPPNHRLDQLFQRLGPHASVDGDTFHYSEADQEHTRLVGTPGESGQNDGGVDSAFRREMRSYGQYNWVQTGDSDRIDACHIVHGLPVDQLTSIAEMQRQYHGKDFQIRLLHVDPNWAALSDLIASTPTTPTNGHSPTNGAAAGHGPTNGSGAGPNTGGTPVTPSTPPTTPRGRI
jgi:hypothetical protein